MTRPKITSVTLVVFLFVISAACTGFLAGRTIKLQEEGKMESFQQVSEQVVDISTAVDRSFDLIMRVILR